MADEQIIKALKCLTKDNASCDDRLHCYFMFKEPSCFNCYHEIAKNALDLINRQKAEIDVLYKICKKSDEEISELNSELAKRQSLEESFSKTMKQFDKRLAKTVRLERAEAIKEFAERLKATYPSREDERCTLDMCYSLDVIDNLVEEMTEGGQ